MLLVSFCLTVRKLAAIVTKLRNGLVQASLGLAWIFKVR